MLYYWFRCCTSRTFGLGHRATHRTSSQVVTVWEWVPTGMTTGSVAKTTVGLELRLDWAWWHERCGTGMEPQKTELELKNIPQIQGTNDSNLNPGLVWHIHCVRNTYQTETRNWEKPIAWLLESKAVLSSLSAGQHNTFATKELSGP